MCGVLNESLATEVINNSTLARWLTTVTAHELKTFANEPIPVIGMMQAPIESNGCQIEEAEFVVVKDDLTPLIGRDLLDELGISITQTLCSSEDEETVTPNEMLPKENWGTSRSDNEVERKMCKATRDTSTREQLANDNELSFLRATNAHCPIPFKEHAVQIKTAWKKHPHRSSKKNLDGLFEELAPGPVVQKTDQSASVIREPWKLEVTVQNSDIAKFGTRDERKTKLMNYVNRRGPLVH